MDSIIELEHGTASRLAAATAADSCRDRRELLFRA